MDDDDLDDELEGIIAEMEPGGYHVLPYGDIADHKECISCWCCPRLIYRDTDEGKEIWAHRFAMENPN